MSEPRKVVLAEEPDVEIGWHCVECGTTHVHTHPQKRVKNGVTLTAPPGAIGAIGAPKKEDEPEGGEGA